MRKYGSHFHPTSGGRAVRLLFTLVKEATTLCLTHTQVTYILYTLKWEPNLIKYFYTSKKVFRIFFSFRLISFKVLTKMGMAEKGHFLYIHSNYNHFALLLLLSAQPMYSRLQANETKRNT